MMVVDNRDNFSACKGMDADGEDLFRLASMLRNKLKVLETLKPRDRIRKDPRLEDLGVGFHKDVSNYLKKNQRLIAFLSNAALERGYTGSQVHRLLAESLYEQGALEQAEVVLKKATAGGNCSPALKELLAKTLLRARNGEALDVYAGLRGLDKDDLDIIEVVDFPYQERWMEAVGADPVVLVDRPREALGNLRCVVDGTKTDLDIRISSSPLQAARVRNLKVLSGVVPYVDDTGYYDLDLTYVLGLVPLVEGVAKNRLAAATRREEEKVFSGKYLVPSSPMHYYENYFHGPCQVFARIATALQYGGLDDWRVLLPGNLPNWALEFLSLTGVGADRIDFMPMDAVSRVEEALLLPMKWDVCPVEIDTVRQRIASFHPPGEGDTDYYLVRKGAVNQSRVLANEEDFIKICRDRGFQVVNPLDYSLAEQIRLFSRARTIVTPASSAYTNMLYAPAGAEVVMILPKLFFGMLATDLAACCGHGMSIVFGEFLAGARNVIDPHNPYFADAKAFETLLDGLWAKRGL